MSNLPILKQNTLAGFCEGAGLLYLDLRDKFQGWNDKTNERRAFFEACRYEAQFHGKELNMPKFSRPGIGHNSVQVPHDGKLVKGAKFKAQSFFRPTGMSVAMAAAGLIPDVHLVRDLSLTGLLRHKHDNRNIRPSARVAF